MSPWGTHRQKRIKKKKDKQTNAATTFTQQPFLWNKTPWTRANFHHLNRVRNVLHESDTRRHYLHVNCPSHPTRTPPLYTGNRPGNVGTLHAYTQNRNFTRKRGFFRGNDWLLDLHLGLENHS